ncbi:DUF4402 domain-containing protein [Geomonas azotofigens]|uniref:DUF4402 domain-containing protein n=1 Tax=Geomonas azotofigens TaxID=2843196 RepID=UPI001C0F99A3|nr:DUF4402 domain-containing protein [Geomonas azotofigens]MBU5612000.1 DUF4402 domain-containing protein [Geomonas azotofigens]
MIRSMGLPAKFGAIFLMLWLAAAEPAFAAPTSVTKNQDINFGKVVGGAGRSGTVTISPYGGRIYTGSVMPLGTAFSAASYTIAGTAGKNYTITLPASVTINAGPDQMTITSLTASVPLAGVIPAAGVLSFAVGGTLNVNSVQRNTLYSGNLTVSVK